MQPVVRGVLRAAVAGPVALLLVLLTGPAAAQQIDIPRVELMPNLPQPYEMRDWHAVALAYDSLVFDASLSGQYLPLVFDQTPVNFPALNPIGLDTYVGSDNSSGEAINILPAVVGASLVGIDKSAQSGLDYVSMMKEWFNSANGLDLYLNNPAGSTGNDWWYETMPNLFFYQLYDLYPTTPGFAGQLSTVADRWRNAVTALGGSTAPWTPPNFDYRSFNFATMTAVSGGWSQPEAAGAVAWLLYMAYRETGEESCRIGAELALDFLESWPSNPSYEIQMPWGVQAAARMNAELPADYDIETMINWVFEMSAERNWGVVVGSWGGYDVSGLVGEVDADGYAFAMNGFQTAAALVPVARYDDRFARAIGKWVLNLANASRLYYTAFLPDSLQDGEWWTQQHDPASTIAHEALRESWDAGQGSVAPFATGDASYGGWAPTNFAIYGSSHVGYLGSIVDSTDVPGILRLDTRSTDFFQDQAYPSELLYNPYGAARTVTLDVGPDPVRLWEMVTDAWLTGPVSGSVQLTIPADEARLIVRVPGAATTSTELGILYADGVPVDYRAAATGNRPPRIRSAEPERSWVLAGDSLAVYVNAIDVDGDPVTWSWSVSAGSVAGSGQQLQYHAPAEVGEVTLQLVAADPAAAADTATITLNVVLEAPPAITALQLDPPTLLPSGSATAICEVDPPGEYNYSWSSSRGSFSGQGDSVSWQAPPAEGIDWIRCTVSTAGGAAVSDSVRAVVGDLVLHLMMDGSADDSSPFANHGLLNGGSFVPDRFGNAEAALALDGVDDHISVANTPALSPTRALSLCAWFDVVELPSEEEVYLVSHGSWENRWKVTLGSSHRLRWTVNTDEGITDLDSGEPINAQLHHMVATFGEGEIRLYIDGSLSASTARSGELLRTDLPLLVGQKVPGEQSWNFEGTVDDLRLYNRVISADEVQALYNLVSVPRRDAPLPRQLSLAAPWPNPFNSSARIAFTLPRAAAAELLLYNLLGQRVRTVASGKYSAGRHAFVLQAGQLASGWYVVELRADSAPAQRRRILLLR